MKNLCLIVFFLMNALVSKSQDEMKIIYVYDALCGWCYGFSPVIKQFQAKYQEELDFDVISGGMITGDRIGPIGEVASYIGETYKHVEDKTGVKFGKAFLENTLAEGTTIFTSIPSAIAMSLFKSMKPKSSIQFAGALQKGIYFDGIAPEDLDAYGKIAEEFGLNAVDFSEKMKEDIYAKAAQEDFQKSTELGVTGFPSVFVEQNGKYYKIGSGYMSLNTLESNYLAVKYKK